MNIEVNYFFKEGRIICVTTIFDKGEFIYDQRQDVTDELSEVFQQYLQQR